MFERYGKSNQLQIKMSELSWSVVQQKIKLIARLIFDVTKLVSFIKKCTKHLLFMFVYIYKKNRYFRNNLSIHFVILDLKLFTKRAYCRKLF